VNSDELRVICRERLGVRIGPAMAKYVVDRIAARGTQPAIPIIGGDARTGVPLLKELPPTAFTNE
jgi:hypothetical protein